MGKVSVTFKGAPTNVHCMLVLWEVLTSAMGNPDETKEIRENGPSTEMLSLMPSTIRYLLAAVADILVPVTQPDGHTELQDSWGIQSWEGPNREYLERILQFK